MLRDLRPSHLPSNGTPPPRSTGVPAGPDRLETLWSANLPCSAINPPRIKIHQHLAKLLVVENLLIDLVVRVDACNDGLQELPVEGQAEVVEAVALGLIRQLIVGGPA